VKQEKDANPNAKSDSSQRRVLFGSQAKQVNGKSGSSGLAFVAHHPCEPSASKWILLACVAFWAEISPWIRAKPN